MANSEEFAIAGARVAAGGGHRNQGANGGQLQQRLRVGLAQLGELLRRQPQAGDELRRQAEWAITLPESYRPEASGVLLGRVSGLGVATIGSKSSGLRLMSSSRCRLPGVPRQPRWRTGLIPASRRRTGFLAQRGEPIVIRVAFKPTATIRKEQQTIDSEGNATTLAAKGRHYPCVLPRAVPMVEAMVALVLADHLLRQRGQCSLW